MMADSEKRPTDVQAARSPGLLPKDDWLPPLLKRISLESFPFLAIDTPENREVTATGFSGQDVETGSRSLLSSPRNSERGSNVNTLVFPPVDASHNATVLAGASSNRKSADGVVDANEVQNAGHFSNFSASEPPSTTHPTTFEDSSPLVELSKKVFFEKAKNSKKMSTEQQEYERPKTFRSETERGISGRATSGVRKGRAKLNGKKFYSQPMPMRDRSFHSRNGYSGPVRGSRLTSFANDDYTAFKTKSGMLERQISRLTRGEDKSRQHETPHMTDTHEPPVHQTLPAGRYFDALKGPELEILKDSEESLLPLDQKWPFLLRFPMGCFGITLGLGSQTILWKALVTTSSMKFLHIPKSINLVLWCLALIALIMVSVIYLLKIIFYFEAVRREYYHPVRVNFFFAPWIACMFLTLGVPPAISSSVHPVLWCLFMMPIFVLELKIYGQWLSGGHRRLSLVANPSTHLSLVGNFVGALLAGMVGWKEPAIFFWAVGLAHYLVLFVTLYQRLPTAEVLTKELHPVFFLFVAAPNAASVAWESIAGDFDYVSRICYFVGLFLYASLVVRLNFFRGFRFTVAWWAYTFPMTASAIATIHYSHEVRHPITQGLAVFLSSVSAITVFILFVSTIFHACLWGTLFPNDIAIAITSKRRKRKLKVATDNSLCEVTVDSLPNGGDECHKDGSNNLPK